MNSKRSYLYEGMYIISSSLSEDARKKAVDKIANSITEKGGEIHKIHEMGRRRLAYEIRKRREGYYFLIYFTVASDCISEIWKDYHLHEDLLRFMTLRADKVKETLEFKPLNPN